MSENDDQLKKLNEEVAASLEHEPEEQYLTFFMDNEEYGIDILAVQEIRGWEPATAIPNAPSWVKGVINLRGTVVPIIDLRQRFGIKSIRYDATTVVIVVKAKTASGDKVVGVVVDAVSDVHNFSASEIQPSPEMSGNSNTRFVKGLGTSEEVMVILLNIHALIDADDDSEFSAVRQLTQA